MIESRKGLEQVQPSRPRVLASSRLCVRIHPHRHSGGLVISGLKLMFWLGWALFAGVVLWVIPPVAWFLSRRLLPTDRSVDDDCPDVVVIVPARNEEEAIANALTSILRSDYPKLKLIAINDRSTDRTGELMNEVARQDVRCQIVHVEFLPDGWLGKNHAMHVAAESVLPVDTSEPHNQLLLFTDGDVIYESAAISSAVHYLQDRQLDHLALLPRMIPGSYLENSVVAFFGLALAIGQQSHLITTRWPFAYAGVGAFNLITSELYRRFDGHQRIAMDVLDDMKLGKLAKQHGGRQDFLGAPDLLSLRWYHSLWGVITGLEKNGFAALNYSLWELLMTSIVFFSTMVAPYVLIMVLPVEQSMGFLAAIATWHVMYALTAARFGGGILQLPMFPIAAWLMAIAFWRSAWVTLRQGGIRWRESFYSLKELRSRIYR
jgi:glycosyltransferase involved in cell wall biosynthesis